MRAHVATSSHRLARLLLAAVLLTLVGAPATWLLPTAAPKATAAAPRSAAAPSELRIFDHNACANKCNVGVEQRVTDAIISSVRDSDPPLTYVTLQEMCEDQVLGHPYGIAARTRDLGYNWTFLPTGPTCEGGDAYGLAVGYQGYASDTLRYTLPNPDDHEPRKMLCVAIQGSGSIGCSDHINQDRDGTRAEQIAYVRQAAIDGAEGKSPLFAYGTAIIAGDFNARPDEDVMDTMYESMSREVFGIDNRDNSPITHDGPLPNLGGIDNLERIDYVFAVDMRGIGNASGQVTDSKFSDHKIIRGVIRQ